MKQNKIMRFFINNAETLLALATGAGFFLGILADKKANDEMELRDARIALLEEKTKDL